MRGRATLLLCELVGKLESGLLNADEGKDVLFYRAFSFNTLATVHYLSTFFCDRLKDSSLITPYVLQGLVSLVSVYVLYTCESDGVYVCRSLTIH